MKTESIQINLPSSWEEVTVSQFQEIITLHSDIDKTNTIIGILTNEDDEVIKRMTLESRKKIIETLSWTNKMPDDKFYKTEIDIDGTFYYLRDLNELSFEEWLELTSYCKNYQVNLHKIFSVLYQCEGKQPSNKHSLFENKVMIGDIYGVLVFFSIIANKSITSIKSCIKEEVLKTAMMTMN